MRKNLIAILIGLVTSVTGGYLYTYLIKINFPFIYLIGALCVLVVMSVALYIFRGKVFLLFSSEIIGFYPKGQDQYIDKAVSEISNSQKIEIVGARGMDLIGENSSIGIALRKANNLSEISAYLLEPGGEHSRLRSEHLEVEKRKYEAECISVDNFIGILKIQADIPITKYSYTTKPLFRLIITDRSVFLSFYQSGIRGRDLPCWHISRKSKTLFPQIQRFIDNLKSTSTVKIYANNRVVT